MFILPSKSDGQCKNAKQQDAENQTEVVSSLKAWWNSTVSHPHWVLRGYPLVNKLKLAIEKHNLNQACIHKLGAFNVMHHRTPPRHGPAPHGIPPAAARPKTPISWRSPAAMAAGPATATACGVPWRAKRLGKKCGRNHRINGEFWYIECGVKIWSLYHLHSIIFVVWWKCGSVMFVKKQNETKWCFSQKMWPALLLQIQFETIGGFLKICFRMDLVKMGDGPVKFKV